MSQDRRATREIAVFHILLNHFSRWVIPTLLLTGAATAYAFLRTPKWEASQALIVRNEATSNSEQQSPGKFDRVEQRKTVQETIMELFRSHDVLMAALKDVGPPLGREVFNWPHEKDLADARELIKLSPPNGLVFGETEIFYLKVKDGDRPRTVELAEALCRHVRRELQELRNTTAESMIAELENAVAMAKLELDEATARLADVESQAAGDLAELRMLQTSPSGDSDLRRRRVEIEAELRVAKQAVRTNEELRRLLTSAQADAKHLIATPNTLLQSQPALQRLKDGLIDTQIRTARLKGMQSNQHPEVMAARASQDEIRRHLKAELDIAIRAIDVDLRLTRARVDDLAGQLATTSKRLGRLAAVRAQYGKTLREIEHLTKIQESSQASLAEARASGAAAYSSNLLNLIGHPETGHKPTGPSTALIILAGIAGGLTIGIALMFLTVQPDGGYLRTDAVGSFRAKPLLKKGQRSVREALERLKLERMKWVGTPAV